MDNEFVVDTNLGILEFSVMTEAIVNGYFDSDGDYRPHIGMANEMRLFYNACVKKSPYDDEVPHDFTDIMLVDKLAANKEFVEKFNSAIYENIGDRGLDFANAHSCAMDIVDQRNNPLNTIVVLVRDALLKILDSVNKIMTPENMDFAKEVAEDVTSGKIDYAKFLTDFKDSAAFSRVVGKDKPTDKSAVNWS